MSRMLVDVSAWLKSAAAFASRRRSAAKRSFYEFTSVHFHGPNQ